MIARDGEIIQSERGEVSNAAPAKPLGVRPEFNPALTSKPVDRSDFKGFRVTATSLSEAKRQQQQQRKAFQAATPKVVSDCGLRLEQLDKFLRGQPRALDRPSLHVLAKRLGLD